MFWWVRLAGRMIYETGYQAYTLNRNKKIYYRWEGVNQNRVNLLNRNIYFRKFLKGILPKLILSVISVIVNWIWINLHLVILMAWRVSLYFHSSFSPISNTCEAITKPQPKLTYKKLLWLFEEPHVTKPMRSVLVFLSEQYDRH